MDCDLAQAFAAAWTSHAFAAGQGETGPVYRAHQKAVLAAQELAGCPIQATPRMRAYVQPRADIACPVAMHDQRFRIAFQHRLDLMQAVDIHRLQLQQGCARGVDAITV